MIDVNDHHRPSPEFRASLERDIVNTFRRETQFAPPVPTKRLRTLVTLGIGLIIGVGSAVASTQVADARQRQEIASTTEARRELAAVQVTVARANYDQVQHAFDKGAITRASLLSAEAELQEMKARVARLELDLAESRRTAAPPRDELWAPLVDGRDFVNERLLIEATSARQRFASADAAAVDAERALQAGVLTRPALAQVQSDKLQARRDVDGVAQKLALRRQFLRERLAPDDVARRLQRFELMSDVERAEQLLRQASERVAVARDRSTVGPARAVKAKQAEVLVLERSLELEQLRLDNARSALTYRAPEQQQGIPTVDLPAASAKTSASLGALLGIREVGGGRVLVNDVGSRQLRLFDTTLTTSTVALDSTPGVANRYGARVPLVRFLGDSSLLPDIATRTIRVLDGRGQVARTFALPNVSAAVTDMGYTDNRGRVLYSAPGDLQPVRAAFDSVLILRFDLESRRVDTVARVRNRNSYSWILRDSMAPATAARGGGRGVVSFLPRKQAGLLPGRDDWAVLSDGSVALVRGQDYHIDWIRPDGSVGSSPKLPFDWQRVDSQRFSPASLYADRIAIDSTRRARGSAGRGVLSDTLTVRLLQARVQYTLFVLNDNLINNMMAPQQTFGAAMPDLDGNLWILPTSPALSATSQLVYDVVNGKGQLFQRVRMPAGRSVAGFGKGGVVYLVSGSPTDGFYLERTRFGSR